MSQSITFDITKSELLDIVSKHIDHQCDLYDNNEPVGNILIVNEDDAGNVTETSILGDESVMFEFCKDLNDYHGIDSRPDLIKHDTLKTIGKIGDGDDDTFSISIQLKPRSK